MKALFLYEPGHASVDTIQDAARADEEVLLKVRMVGLCGSDLNSYRGKNPVSRENSIRPRNCRVRHFSAYSYSLECFK